MKKRLIALMLVFAMLCVAPAALAKTYLTMAAVASSSGLFPYVVSIGKVLNTYCPDYSITVSESGGNVDNTKRLRNGEVKIANSISNTDYESYTGTGTTFNGSPYKDFRILWYYEKSPIQICVAKDTGIESIYDLEGKKFNPGGTGTACGTHRIPGVAVKDSAKMPETGIQFFYHGSISPFLGGKDIGSTDRAIHRVRDVAHGDNLHAPQTWIQGIVADALYP